MSLKLFVPLNVFFGNMAFFYAVARGRKPGIYNSWEECKAQVDKFAGPIFKKFSSKTEAENFIKSRGGPSSKPDESREVFTAAVNTAREVSPTKASNVELPYKMLEQKLLEWARESPKMTKFSVTCEAAKIAQSLAITNFNDNGGWLKYHIESNPDVYRSLRSNASSSATAAQHEVPLIPNYQVASKKLGLLEGRIRDLPRSDGTLLGRIGVFESTLHSLQQEFLIVKRELSTNTDNNIAGPSTSKRRKVVDSPDAASEMLGIENDANRSANFNVDSEGFVNVFTDGACSANGRLSAAAGIGVWFGDNHPLNLSQPVEGRATNNMAEIQAVTVAARQAFQAGVKKLKINTDSQFLISCVTQWMRKWKANGWRTANGNLVINKAELIELEKALEPLEISWNHVRGHVGIHGNEMADQLARAGATRYKK